MKFKAEDFYTPDARCLTAIEASDQANEILESHLATLQRVHGRVYGGTLIFSDDQGRRNTALNHEDTHQALLWDVKPIEKKECEKHKAMFDAKKDSYSCEICGLRLKMGWVPA